MADRHVVFGMREHHVAPVDQTSHFATRNKYVGGVEVAVTDNRVNRLGRPASGKSLADGGEFGNTGCFGQLCNHSR